jgi:hypothetical protein
MTVASCGEVKKKAGKQYFYAYLIKSLNRHSPNKKGDVARIE